MMLAGASSTGRDTRGANASISFCQAIEDHSALTVIQGSDGSSAYKTYPRIERFEMCCHLYHLTRGNGERA